MSQEFNDLSDREAYVKELIALYTMARQLDQTDTAYGILRTIGEIQGHLG